MTQADTPPAELEMEGTVERFIFHNEDNGWSVFKLALPKRGREITAVGTLSAVKPGEYLRLKGRWVQNKEYGPQFQFESYLSILPGTLSGIEKYLGSGLIYGVGKETARRMVRAFGLDVLDILDNDPTRLKEVEGIGAVRLKRIVAGWKAHRDIKDIMIFLQSIGISGTYAAKIYKVYGPGVVAAVKEDPYRLAMDISGIGFKTADKIGANLGIPPTSPRRARAGVLHVLGQVSEKGHVCFPLSDLVQAAADELRIDAAIIEEAIDSLAQDEILAIEDRTPQAFVYLRPLYISETGAAHNLDAFLSGGAAPIAIQIDKALAWFEERHRIQLAPEQKEAITAAIREKVVVITGGPGTGKTTLIRAVIEILEKKNQRIKLAAPTGRAAKRMSEATGRHATTIHRLLEYNPAEMGFDRNQSKPIKADLLILDEVSMVDIVLFHHCIKALPSSARLILVGDADQLPSVGPGSVLNDIIDSKRATTIHLSKIFRQARQSLIVVNAHRINQGLMPYPKTDFGRPDYEFLKHDDPAEALEAVKHLVTSAIPERFRLDPVLDIQVLTPMHKGILGVFNLNLTLQALLNPGKEGIFRGGHKLCVGDKVMQIRNNYELGVFNGDVGRILSLGTDEDPIEVDFDGRAVPYEPADLDELTLAYACSIHKSQGSEYPAVIIVLSTQHFVMLQKNLIYTAITRGRRYVAVVGSPRAMAMAVNNVNRSQRYSLLRHRLEGLL